MRILIVEDDRALADLLSYHLKRAGYDVDISYDGIEGLRRIRDGIYALILLDRMLPGVDGAIMLKSLRGERLNTPVLMITAMGTLSDRVQGLDAGADDYLVKPFQTEELLARVRALLRRPPQIIDAKGIYCGELCLNETAGLLSCAETSCQLSKREAQLLSQFMRSPNRTLSRALLLAYVWGDTPVEDGNLDNYIYFLRKRLKSVGWKGQIRTEHGLGYRLEV